jgi:hypothetical protein
MATKIIHKKSSVGSKIPLASDLEVGELALNLTDKKIYSKQTDGTVVEMSPQRQDLLLSWSLGEHVPTQGWLVLEEVGVIVFSLDGIAKMTISADGSINTSGEILSNESSIVGPTVSQGAGDWSYNHNTTDFFWQHGSTNVLRLNSDGDLFLLGDLETEATLDGATSESYYMYKSGTPRVEITQTGDLLSVSDIVANSTL